MNKLKLNNELCHVKIEEDYIDLFSDEDKAAIRIQVLDGPLKGALIETEVDLDDIDKEYLAGE